MKHEDNAYELLEKIAKNTHLWSSPRGPAPTQKRQAARMYDFDPFNMINAKFDALTNVLAKNMEDLSMLVSSSSSSGSSQQVACAEELPAVDGTTEKCKACDKTVHFIEMITADGISYHKTCFKCSHCNGLLLARAPGKLSSMFCGTQDKCARCNKTAYPLEKIMARKAGCSYLEVEKSFYKNRGKIVEIKELPFDASEDERPSNSLDGLNLVRPVRKKGFRFQADYNPVAPVIKKPANQLEKL
ncbi:hypothetical protein GH714_002744 [Hevea brasiliensis]|uniref:LIM zinc-binding domain-containing protein n=1 Tax=Hevea brasiliensis TaxID=3981 RepID=A0A6A6LDR0_HEVBR|nr:hypothetical protein GH714_002744 [Hevea brasiliensis]